MLGWCLIGAKCISGLLSAPTYFYKSRILICTARVTKLPCLDESFFFKVAPLLSLTFKTCGQVCALFKLQMMYEDYVLQKVAGGSRRHRFIEIDYVETLPSLLI